MTKEQLTEVLRGWTQLNKDIMTLSEADIAKLVDHERKHKGRLRVLIRLYNRFSKLRAQREKVELMQHVKA